MYLVARWDETRFGIGLRLFSACCPRLCGPTFRIACGMATPTTGQSLLAVLRDMAKPFKVLDKHDDTSVHKICEVAWAYHEGKGLDRQGGEHAVVVLRHASAPHGKATFGNLFPSAISGLSRTAGITRTVGFPIWQVQLNRFSSPVLSLVTRSQMAWRPVFRQRWPATFAAGEWQRSPYERLADNFAAMDTLDRHHLGSVGVLKSIGGSRGSCAKWGAGGVVECFVPPRAFRARIWKRLAVVLALYWYCIGTALVFYRHCAGSITSCMAIIAWCVHAHALAMCA